MAKFKYDPEIRGGEIGERLYACWKRVKGKTDDPVFSDYASFYEWAMDAGYTIGALLYRRNPDGPYTSDNCFWVARSSKSIEGKRVDRDKEWEKAWDDAVNRIRRHYGMEPIGSSEV
jgi:hypothetical protein